MTRYKVHLVNNTGGYAGSVAYGPDASGNKFYITLHTQVFGQTGGDSVFWTFGFNTINDVKDSSGVAAPIVSGTLVCDELGTTAAFAIRPASPETVSWM